MEINANLGGDDGTLKKSSVEKKGCCFLCLTLIPISDFEDLGTETKSIVSLKILQRYFQIGRESREKEVPLPGISDNKTVNSSSFVLAATVEQDIEVDLCEPCTGIVNKFNDSFLSLEKAQMELNYWSGRIHQQIISSEGSQNRGLSKRMRNEGDDPETLAQLVFVDNLRKEIAKKSFKMGAGQDANVHLNKSKLKPSKEDSSSADSDPGSPAAHDIHSTNDDDENDKNIDISRLQSVSPASSNPQEVSRGGQPAPESSSSPTTPILSPTEMYFRSSETGAYHCSACNKELRSSQIAKRHHQAIHQGKRFPCDLCKRTFTQNASLLTHKKICNGIWRNSYSPRDSDIMKGRFNPDTRNYTCTACNEDFTISSKLYAHYNLVHLKKSFKCEICKLTFVNLDSLKRHGKRKICTTATSTKRTKTQIGRDTDAANPPAKTSTETRQPLKKWVKNTETGTYVCSVCSKELKSAYAARVHYDGFHQGKRFPCEICKLNFTFRASLMRHQKATCRAAAGKKQIVKAEEEIII